MPGRKIGLARRDFALFTLLFLLGWGRLNPGACAASVQERVVQLVQDAISGSSTNAAKSSTNSSWESTLRVEADFREACQLLPERLDLRFCLASALIGQAMHTNGAPLFNAKMREALAIYQEIGTLDPQNSSAPILCAAYARAIGDAPSAEVAINQAMARAPERTREYLERFQRVEGFLEIVPNEKLGPPSGGGTQAIVILGAALETNGVAKPKLIRRLEQGLKLARACPAAAIIVTGGNQKNGITESYVMGRWLRRHGVAASRIQLDDQARDTVGNALYSAAILKRLGATDVTVVTSANHIRRGLADLEEACLQKGLPVHLSNLAAGGEPELEKRVERVGAYRDVLRVSGLWSYPGIQR